LNVGVFYAISTLLNFVVVKHFEVRLRSYYTMRPTTALECDDEALSRAGMLIKKCAR